MRRPRSWLVQVCRRPKLHPNIKTLWFFSRLSWWKWWASRLSEGHLPSQAFHLWKDQKMHPFRVSVWKGFLWLLERSFFSGSLLFWANSKPLKIVPFQYYCILERKKFVKAIFNISDFTRILQEVLRVILCLILTQCFLNSDRFCCMTDLRDVETSILWAVCVNVCGMIFMHIFRIFFAFKKDHHSTSVWYSCQLFCLQWPS